MVEVNTITFDNFIQMFTFSLDYLSAELLSVEDNSDMLVLEEGEIELFGKMGLAEGDKLYKGYLEIPEDQLVS